MKTFLVRISIVLHLLLECTEGFQNMDAVNQLLRFSRNIMGPIIFPGTKWCGTGNVATNFTDLGILKDLDMCCRTHDSCPDVILAEATKYNLTNTSSFTRVSCDCDHSFYNCLKSTHKIYADLVGKTYFVYSRTKCFSSCRTNFEDGESCVEYETNPNRELVYKWVDLPYY